MRTIETPVQQSYPMHAFHERRKSNGLNESSSCVSKNVVRPISSTYLQQKPNTKHRESLVNMFEKSVCIEDKENVPNNIMRDSKKRGPRKPSERRRYHNRNASMIRTQHRRPVMTLPYDPYKQYIFHFDEDEQLEYKADPQPNRDAYIDAILQEVYYATFIGIEKHAQVLATDAEHMRVAAMNAWMASRTPQEREEYIRRHQAGL